MNDAEGREDAHSPNGGERSEVAAAPGGGPEAAAGARVDAAASANAGVPSDAGLPDFETEPFTRPEYLSAMVHFYRAEVHRATAWRTRLDATTNWAVVTSAGMLSFTFANPSHSDFLLLLTNLVLVGYLMIEARRYRRYELYQARVRMLEENFVAPIVTRRLASPREVWRAEVARDLTHPTYKSPLLQIVGLRLRRNYAWIHAVILGAWLLKLELHPTLATSFEEVWARAGEGTFLRPEIVVGGGVLFYAVLISLMFLGRRPRDIGPSDEVEGVEPHIERWKV